MAISVLVAFNQYKYNKTNQCTLLYVYEFNQYKQHKTNQSIFLYTRKVQIPRVLTCLETCRCYCLMSLFWRCSWRLGQLYPNPGPQPHMRPIRRFCVAH